MIITMENGIRTDYGVFAVEYPFMEVLAIKSTDYCGTLSGDIPAIMVIHLETGEVYHTDKFTACDSTFSEFYIKDKELIDNILPKFRGIYMEELKAVGIIQDSSGWSLFAEFVPALPEEQEPYAFLELPSVFWTTGERFVMDKSAL